MGELALLLINFREAAMTKTIDIQIEEEVLNEAMRRAGTALLIAAIAFAVLMNGAVELWCLCIVAAPLAVAVVLLIWNEERYVRRRSASILFWSTD